MNKLQVKMFRDNRSLILEEEINKFLTEEQENGSVDFSFKMRIDHEKDPGYNSEIIILVSFLKTK
jgi:hypothetical protein